MTVVARTSLREQAKEPLADRILTGFYAPGERLVETRIANELGTSQAPIREALRELELLRLVESEPHRGSRIREVSPAGLAQICPVRAALEELAAREAATRLDGDVRDLAMHLDHMREAAAAADLTRLVEHNVAFHRRIVEAAGKPVFLELWTSLRPDLRTAVTCLASGIDLVAIANRHEPILTALAARDSDRAGAAMREHIESSTNLVLEGGIA